MGGGIKRVMRAAGGHSFKGATCAIVKGHAQHELAFRKSELAGAATRELIHVAADGQAHADAAAVAEGPGSIDGPFPAGPGADVVAGQHGKVDGVVQGGVVPVYAADKIARADIEAELFRCPVIGRALVVAIARIFEGVAEGHHEVGELGLVRGRGEFPINVYPVITIGAHGIHDVGDKGVEIAGCG